jgi:hypothetical protein
MTLPYGYYGKLLEYTEYTLADHAIPGNTPREQPQGPLVVPGNYTLELSAAGRVVRQPLTVKLDPRLQTSNADLQAQADLEREIALGMEASYRAYHQVAALRTALAERKKGLGTENTAAALEKKIDAVGEGTRTAPGFGPVNRDLARLAGSAQSADIRPAETVRTAVEDKCKSLGAALTQWREVNEQDLIAFNAQLQAKKLAPLPVVQIAAKAGCAP